MRIFVTHILPEHLVAKYGLSFAAYNFSCNLISGGLFDKVYSVLPTFVHGDIKTFEGLVYSKVRNNKVLRCFAPMVENVALFRMLPRKSVVWYYNCTILNALLIILLMLFKPSVKQYMIILDYTPGFDVKGRFFLWLTNKMDGTIRLADSPLFTVKNSICLPGVVPLQVAEYPKVERISPDFLISGVLGENIAMLSMLLEAFSIMPELRLHITGKAPNEKQISQFTKRYPNIIFHGMVAYEEYLRILHSCPFQLSTRNPQMPENQCNFPSKIIEALLHNRIIVSTIHYPQLEGMHYFEVATDTKTFAEDIKRIANMDKGVLLKYANQGEEVKRRFNTDIWCDAMCKIELKQMERDIVG